MTAFMCLVVNLCSYSRDVGIASGPEETILNELVSRKNEFIHQKLSKVYEFLKQKKKFVINHATTTETNPWNPCSDGKLYIESIVLFSKDFYELNEDGEDYYEITIELDMNHKVERQSFWSNIPDDETWIQVFVDQSKDFIVKNLSWSFNVGRKW